MNKFMEVAISEARTGINNGHGGPFGCVIVKDNEIIGKGHNEVLLKHDPTCHGEIMAIHEACATINSYDLSGTVLYTTGEPCPMCLGAILWANIEKVYYGCNILDNELIGFRDKKFDELMGSRANLDNYLIELDRDECLKLFDEYQKLNREKY